jgi:hypothetical protein
VRRRTEFCAPARKDDDLLAAQRKDQRHIAHHDDATNQVDFKHTVSDVTPIARILIIANVVAKCGKHILLRTQHTYQQGALTVDLDFVAIPIST